MALSRGEAPAARPPALFVRLMLRQT